MSTLSSATHAWREEWTEWRREASRRGPVWLALQIAISVLVLAVLWLVGRGLWAWATSVAEWGVVTENLRLFAIGPYPAESAWRPAVALALVASLLGASGALWGGVVRNLSRMLAACLATLVLIPALAQVIGAVAGVSLGELAAGLGEGAAWFALALGAQGLAWAIATSLSRRIPVDSRRRRRADRVLRALWLASLPAVLVILHGVGQGAVPARDWGGLLLTLLLATVSLVLAFPLGILLALGRRSRLPLVRVVSILYIELIRGVPLVTVLYMASLMVPLVLPPDVRPETMVRAIVGFALFTSAYVAEDVRGGLAALDIGQYEAAEALGLSTFDANRLIILPQAIRVIIPSLVGHFISLFKDTSLVVIIGLRELMGIAMAVVNQPEWIGLFQEVLLFIAVVYFVFSYAMSRTSRQLESQLGGGE